MGNAFKANANFIYWQSGAPTINPVFADNDWSAIIYACQHNMVPDTWVADGSCYKDMEINGTNYRIDIIGKNHDTYADGGTAPLTFQMHDCYSEPYVLSGVGVRPAWTECEMRTSTLPMLLKLMPAVVRLNVREVVKVTAQYPGDNTKVETNDKLFLLSGSEIFNFPTNSFAGEGNRYEYYIQQSSGAIKRVVNGTSVWWWLRSPVSAGLPNVYVAVVTSGGSTNAPGTYSEYIAFAFCF